MNEDDENLSEKGLQDPYESEIKKVDPYESELKKEKDAEKKRVEEAATDLTEGKIRRKRTEETDEDLDSNLLGSRILDAIDSRIYQFGEFIAEAAEDKEGWTDDVVRGALGGLQWLGNLPVLKQLGQLEEGLVSGVGNLAERQDFIDPRLFTYTTRVGTAFIPYGGAIKALTKTKKLAKAAKVVDAGFDSLGATDDLMRQHAGLRARLLNSIDPEGGGGIQNVTPSGSKGKVFTPEGNWRSKYTKNFSDTSKLQKYEEAAFKHRELRQQTAKKDLMKGFIFEDNKPYVVDDTGQKYLLVRRNKRVDKKNFISNKNYELLPEDVILDRLLRKSGWTQGSRELREIKRTLNKQNFSLLSDPKYYEPLIEHGVGNVYLEHKIARGQSWFWNEVAKNPNFAPWLDRVMGPNLRTLGRNSEYNIRILFNQDYKKLKDGVESQLNVINSNKKINEKFIINIEDPQHVASSGNVDFAKMNNPGNISVLKAGTGEKVGVIPDYLMNLYSKDFKKKWSKNYKFLIDRPNNEVPKFYRLYTKKYKNPDTGKMVLGYETLEDWRKRVIGERINLILRKSDDTSAFEIGKHVVDDRTDFFEIFDQRTDWIEPPSTIRNEPEFLNYMNE